MQPAETSVVDPTHQVLTHWLVARVDRILSSVGKKAFVCYKIVALDALNVNFLLEGKPDATTEVV